jgi:hypothetical protein
MDLWQKHKASGWDAFDTYTVDIRINHIVGGKPASEDMIEKWVSATCKQKTAEERQSIIDAHAEDLADITDEKASKQMVIFGRDDSGLYIEGRQVKAMLKEAGNIIKSIAPGEGGVKNLKSKVADQVFVSEEKIPLGRDEPDRVVERAIHVMTAQGPRTSIKRSEICDDVELQFTVRRRKGADKMAVPEKVMLAILDYAQTVGLGADRSQGFGQFKVLSVTKAD